MKIIYRFSKIDDFFNEIQLTAANSYVLAFHVERRCEVYRSKACFLVIPTVTAMGLSSEATSECSEAASCRRSIISGIIQV